MNQGYPPMYMVRGAQPRPAPGAGTVRSSWRGSLILVAVMFGWMIFVFALAAIAAPMDPNQEVPIPLDRGVIVTPADGWYSAADVWEVEQGAVSLQRAGAMAAFAAEEYSGANDDLLDEQLGYLEQDFDSFRVLPASSSTIAGDIPALTALFTGSADSTRLEGELVVASYGGTAVIMLAVAPAGQLAQVQDDLDAMLENMEVPR